MNIQDLAIAKAKAEAADQGLPEHVEDSRALQNLAALIVYGKGAAG